MATEPPLGLCRNIQIELGVKPSFASNVAPAQIRDHRSPDVEIGLRMRCHCLHNGHGQRDGIVSSQCSSTAAEGGPKAGGYEDGFGKAAHADLQN